MLDALRKLLRFATAPPAAGAPGAVPPATRKEAEQALTDELAVGYRPNMPAAGFWEGSSNLPNLQQMLVDVEAMLAHPRVSICLDYYKGGLADLQLGEEDVEASGAEEKAFILAEWQRFWARCRVKVLRSYDYGRLGCEAVYDHEDGLLRLHDLRDFFPLDATVLSRHKEFAGVRVRSLDKGTIDLWGAGWLPAKGFWFGHNLRYSRWYGLPQLYPAWRPWRRLAGRDGAEEIVDGGVYRFAFRGPVGRYPMEDAPGKATGYPGYDQAGKAPNNRDKMREFCENAKAGVSVAMSSRRDDKGNYVWDLEWPEHTLDVSGLLAYTGNLEDAISLGIGVPPELLEASDTGSGYSGRAIPLIAFAARQQANAEAVVWAWLWQIGLPLLRWNFGPQAWARVTVPNLLKAKMQLLQGNGQGAQQQPPEQGQSGRQQRFATDPWVAYQGPHGGQGWKNTSTGQVVYQKEKPAGQQSGGPAQPAALPSDQELARAKVEPLAAAGAVHGAGGLAKVTVGGRPYFFKAASASESAREAATADLARIAGVNVPAARTATVGGRPGVLSDWVEGQPGDKDKAAFLAAVKRDPAAAARLALFHFVVGAEDRHGGNHRVTAQGDVYSTDHSDSVPAHRSPEEAAELMGQDDLLGMMDKAQGGGDIRFDPEAVAGIARAAPEMAQRLRDLGMSDAARSLETRAAVLHRLSREADPTEGKLKSLVGTTRFASQADPWVRYQGPDGGKGWKNSSTGEVIYQEHKPGSAGGAGEGKGPGKSKLGNRLAKARLWRQRKKWVLQKVLAPVGGATDPVAKVVKKFGQGWWNDLPEDARSHLKKTMAFAEAVEHKLQAPYAIIQDTVKETLKDAGVKPARVHRISRYLATADAAAKWTVNIPAVHTTIEATALLGGPAAFLAAKVGYYLPVASAAYLGYRFGRDVVEGNPFRTWKAAWTVIKRHWHGHGHATQASTVRFATEALFGPGTVHAVNDALERHGDSDWFEALLYAALQRTGYDVGAAVRLAEQAAGAQPEEPAGD